MKHIFQSLLERAQSAAEQPFCIFVQGQQEKTITNGEVVSAASSVGQAVSQLGVSTDSVVLIVLEHSEHLYSSFIGTMLAGAIPSFMAPLTRKQDPAVYHASLMALIERIGPAAIISSAKSVGSIPQTDTPVITVEQLMPADGEAIQAQARRAANLQASDTAFLQHSSGTTGLKKGVMLSHEAVLTQCQLYARAIGIQADDTIVSWLPLYHDMGLIACFLLPAIVGAPIVSLDALEWVMRPTSLLQHIERHQGRYVWLPNFAFQHIVRLDNGKKQWDLSSLKAIISCSEPCRSATFEAFLGRYHKAGLMPEALQVSYALAENVFAATHTVAGRAANPGVGERTRGFVSCGAPLSETDVQIRSADGFSVAPGDVGEIWLRSACLFDGYHRQADLTAQKMRDGWYRSGDLGTIEHDQLFVIGRLDDLLIVNGKNLMAHEIEDQINGVVGLIPGRVLVHGRFDDDLGTSQLIILAEVQPATTDLPAIEATVRSTVYSASGVYPVEISFFEPGFLVKSSSGKIARAASFQKYLERTRCQ